MSRSTTRRFWALAVTAGLASGLLARPALAGCGCTKPPPAVAPLRPNVTYSGMPVTFFSSQLVVGQSYTATFTAMNGATGTGTGVAALRRDQGDGIQKPQLRIVVPAGLPLGPASITLSAVGSPSPVLSLADSNFTVAPRPIALPLIYGTWEYPQSQAAVSRDGTVYMSLDLTGMGQPLVFEAQMVGYPLRFDASGIVFKNTQGFLMQKLTQATTTGVEPVPGMSVNPSATPPTASDQVHYSRHEFNTYVLQHAERMPHATDPTDGDWHVDGSRHIDHDHLIVAIVGRLNDGSLPAPGATPPFALRLNAYSLFYQGLVGVSSVTMANSGLTEGFDPTTGAFSATGDVFTTGALTMTGTARIQGSATAKSFSVASTNVITGLQATLPTMSGTVTKRVASGSDDVEEEGTASVHLGAGGMYLNSSDIELVSDTEAPSGGTQKVGLRFTNLGIPRGAIITSAAVTFRAIGADAPNTNTGTTTLSIRAQAADSAAGFTSTRFDISNRPLTTSAATWTPGSWSANTDVVSPSIAAVVQEVVGRTGWASGNSLALIVTGTGSRSAASYESDSARAALLTVSYTLAGTPWYQPPATFLTVEAPANIPSLNAISLSGTSQTIVGPGSFAVNGISLNYNARLTIDNTNGPVTLYVNGDVVVTNGSAIVVRDPNPEKFAIYTLNSAAKVEIKGVTGGTFYGVLYAPNVPITISGAGTFAGALVGKTITVRDTARIRYDRTLRGTW
jgi:hypothetical protein